MTKTSISNKMHKKYDKMYKNWSMWRYPTTVDFETEAINFDRPDQAPRPVGVSIKYWGSKEVYYYGWGHRKDNNCTKKEAIRAIRKAFNHSSILCHNTKFEMTVFCKQLNLPMIPPHGFHDTAIMAFLMNPHEKQLGLKPLADKYLHMPAEERDIVKEWLCDNQDSFNYYYLKTGDGSALDEQRFSTYASGQIKQQDLNWKGWGAYLWEAPRKLLGKYANGDVIRTEKLFDLWFDEILEQGMMEAYKRELEIMPMLLQNQMFGLRVNRTKMKEDMIIYTKVLDELDVWMTKTFKAEEAEAVYLKKNKNFPNKRFWNSSDQIVKALTASGHVDEDDWVIPENKVKISVDKEHLPMALKDKELCAVFRYRSIVKTSLTTFIKNWVRVSDDSGGRIFTSWNQVRNEEGGGARTGRFSTKPNFQNAPKNPWIIFFSKKEETMHLAECRALSKKKGKDIDIPYYKLPSTLRKICKPFPKVRSYIIPDEGCVFIIRDYDGQEVRVFAHFEGGDLKQQFIKNPTLDLHQYVTDLVNEALHSSFTRKQIKTIVFGIMYGMGLAKLGKQLESTKEDAKILKNTIMKLFPGLKELDKKLKRNGKRGVPMVTWGGRIYYVEPPDYVDGEYRTFEYKILNCLVQGSSADCTKQALRNYGMADDVTGRFMITIHDEIVCQVKLADIHIGMERLKSCMSDVDFEIEMRSDGDYSTKNFGELTKYKGDEVLA